MTDDAKKLAALYTGIPTFECRHGCSDCCGPVPVTALEAKRLGIPGQTMTPVKPGTLTCAFVGDHGECTVYDRRPYLCRIFGATVDVGLTCPHGCGPVGKLSMPETDRRSREYCAMFSLADTASLIEILARRPLWRD